MEIVVDELACEKLIEEMFRCVAQAEGIVAEIRSEDANLRTALGEDYRAVAAAVDQVSEELNAARETVKVLKNNTEEYMQKMKEARIILGEN